MPFPTQSGESDSNDAVSAFVDAISKATIEFSGLPVVLKAGAGQFNTCLKTRLRSVLRSASRRSTHCGGINSEVDGKKVVSVLGSLPLAFKLANPEFSTCSAQLEMNHSSSDELGETQETWKLDRHNFLPMILYTQLRLPGSRWFLFLEMDTFVFWNSILSLLSHFDRQQLLYLGFAQTPARFHYSFFVQGGSVFITSSFAKVIFDKKRRVLLSCRQKATVGLVGCSNSAHIPGAVLGAP